MSEPASTSEPGIEMDDTDATSIVVIGLVSTVLVLCSALGVTALYDYTANSIISGRQQEVTETSQYDYIWTANNLHAQEIMINGSPRVLDATKGVYSIPIDRAMGLVLKEMKAEQKTTADE